MRRNKNMVVLGVLFLSLILSACQYISNMESDEPTGSNTYSSASWDYEYSDISELVSASDLIGKVEVGDVYKEYEVNGIPFTQYNLIVVKSIFNCEKGENIVLTMTGINNGEIKSEISDDTLLSKGDMILIFAKKSEDGTYYILGGPQGRFMYINGKLNSMNNVSSRVQNMKINIKDADEESVINEINSSIINK